MSWREREVDGDDLGLNLSLQLKCPSPKSPRYKPSLNGIAFQSSSASRPNTSIDVNKMSTSPDSTGSDHVRGKRSEREETGSDPHSAASSEGGGEGDDSTRKKLKLTKEQAALLEETFNHQNTLSQSEKVELARQLDLETRQVEVWFQNRRARTKLKKTEVDRAYLKRACGNLKAENHQLHKELVELKAQKHHPEATPPTTLTMCPQCERVSMAPQSSPATRFTPPSATGTNTQRHISASGPHDQNRPKASHWLLGKLKG